MKAQQIKNKSYNKPRLPAKTQKKINTTLMKCEMLFEKVFSKQLKTLQKQDKKIYKKLFRKDSIAANEYLLKAKTNMAALHDKLAMPEEVLVYLPSFDSLHNSFSFLSDSSINNSDSTGCTVAKSSFSRMNSLQQKIQQSEQLNKFLRYRKEHVKEQLSTFGISRDIKKINKQAFYYSQQLKEYYALFHDKKELWNKVMMHLRENKLFQEFLMRNSILAGFFPSGRPSNGANVNDFLAANPGLQTRVTLDNIIQNQIASGGPNAQASFQQNLQDAQSQMNMLKHKILKAGSGSSNDILPDGFKPNNQRVKSFLQRVEYGTDVQTQKATAYFPVTSDIAMSVGYKLNNKSIIGIGASFKLGFGSGWNNIRLSAQGLGLRSFIDWKIKNNFFLTGGYEQNYRSTINSTGQLQNFSSWQQSGLIGCSKTVSLKTKFFKKTNVKLLWDFLSYQQTPRTEPFIFRIGYNF